LAVLLVPRVPPGRGGPPAGLVVAAVTVVVVREQAVAMAPLSPRWGQESQRVALKCRRVQGVRNRLRFLTPEPGQGRPKAGGADP